MARKGTRQCQTCNRNRALKFFTGKRGRICSDCKKKSRSKAAHESRVMATYGLEEGEYEKLLQAQGGVCAICKQKRSYRLNVDHCHRTGLVRGLLCRMCNGRLLPASRDSSDLLRSAANYLEFPTAVAYIGERYHHEDGK